MKNSNSISKVQEFLKFKRSQGSLASTVRSSKPDKDMRRQKQEELQQLRDKNIHKQAELSAYHREYEKLSDHVHQTIYHLKSQQDSVQREIELIRLQKNQQISSQDNGSQRIQDLKEQLKYNQVDKAQRRQYFIKEQTQLGILIEAERKRSKQLEEKVEKSEKWIWELNQKQEKEPGLGTINLTGLKNEITLLKTAGTSIVKQQAVQIKRFKKEVEEVKRLIKDCVQKAEQKTKAWSKKCELVLEGKKEFKDVLPESFYTEKWNDKTLDQVENDYRTELAAISQLYEPETRRELGDILTACSIRSQPLVIRQSYERYPVAEIEEDIHKIDQEIKRMEAEAVQKQEETEQFKSYIEKYDKQIDNLKMQVEIKKRKK